MSAGIENIIFGILLTLCLFLFIISFVAMYRGKTLRMLFVTLAFGTFLCKSGVLVAYLFTEFAEPTFMFVTGAMLDTIALLSLYVGVLKR